MYYLVNEWTSDDERLRDDLEQIGIPIQPLQIENILDFIFSNRKVNSPLHMTGLSLHDHVDGINRVSPFYHSYKHIDDIHLHSKLLS